MEKNLNPELPREYNYRLPPTFVFKKERATDSFRWIKKKKKEWRRMGHRSKRWNNTVRRSNLDFG